MGAPEASPGRQSGSNATFRAYLTENEWRGVVTTFYDIPSLSLATAPSPYIPLSMPLRSGPRRIGRPPEEMRLTRFLDGGSLESARSD